MIYSLMFTSLHTSRDVTARMHLDIPALSRTMRMFRCSVDFIYDDLKQTAEGGGLSALVEAYHAHLFGDYDSSFRLKAVFNSLYTMLIT
eukprot:6207431-Pleurochrysis_carterae.AAC.2